VQGETGDKPAVMGTVMADAMVSAMKKAAGGKGNKAQLQAMQAMMEQMFGGAIPTLRSIIGSHELPKVSSDASARDASLTMARIRKGVLVMDDDELVGIFTPKDLLCRVVSKGLSPDDVMVADVMTPNPDCVSPDLTLLDALKEMHDHKYLHLPVRDDNGKVIGLVDVIELVCSTAGGEGAGAGKGWRDFFSGAMEARGDADDISDTASNHSSSSLKSKAKSVGASVAKKVTKDEPKVDAAKVMKQERPVSKLRPKAPITVVETASILEVAQAMAASRADAALNFKLTMYIILLLYLV
jgi:CBS domain-containing protein